MKRTFTKRLNKVLALVLTIVALAAGHSSAWAAAPQEVTVAFTYQSNKTSQGGIQVYQYKYFIVNGKNNYQYISETLNTNYVTFDNQEFNIGDSNIPLTVTLNGEVYFYHENSFTCHRGFNITFTSTSKYIVAARVLTNSDNTYSGCTFQNLDTESVSITIPASSEKGFSAVVLTIAERRSLNTGATISGIDDTYLDDGVNQPVPTVTYKESSNSPSVTLTEGVDYTVRYTYNNDRTSGTVYVEGTGEHYGTFFKSFNIRQLSLDKDFNSLGVGIYEIATKYDLDRLAKFVNNGNDCSGATFRQTADIAYTYNNRCTWNNNIDGILQNNDNFTPIGGYGKPFDGTYDGGGHSISGIRMYRDNNNNNTSRSVGLFGYVQQGTVKNVVLLDANILAYQDIGGIVGFLGNTGKITDCLLYHVRVAAKMKWDIVVGNNNGGTVSGTHFRNCIKEVSGSNGGAYNRYDDLYTLTLGTGVTASATGYTIDGTTYYTAGSDVTLNYSGGSETFTMPARDVIPLLNGYDNSAVIAANVGEGKNVILTGRTLYKDGCWNTLCLPFDVSTSSGTLYSSGVQAKMLNTETSGLDGSTLTLNFEAGSSNIIPAGTPFIIKWESADEDIQNPVFSDVTISTATNDATVPGVLTFKGTYEPISYTSEDKSVLFMGGSNTLYYPQPNLTDPNNPVYPRIDACHAYFQLNGITAGDPNDPSSPVKAFVLNFGDEETTTSVLSMEEGRGKMEDVQIYNLAGQKLSKPQRGVNIINGRKVVIK